MSKKYGGIKGYLTYAVSGPVDEQKLSAVLMTESKTTKYKIVYNNGESRPFKMSDKFAGLLMDKGVKIEKETLIVHTPRRAITVNPDGKPRRIPVVIKVAYVRKKGQKDRIESFRIRISASDIVELGKRIDALKEGLSKWAMPTSCVWNDESWVEEEEFIGPIVDEKEKKSDVERLEKIVSAAAERAVDKVLSNKKEDVAQIKNDIANLPLRRSRVEDRAIKNNR